MSKLDKIYEDIVACNKCGFCQSVCPVFRETRMEGSVARGRIALLREAAEGTLPFDEDLKETLYGCLLCKHCQENCPAGVKSYDIILKAREVLAKEHVPLVQRFIFNHILQFPKRLTLTNRLLKLYEKSGIRSIINKTGMIGVLGPVAKAEDIIPGNISRTFRDLEKTLTPNLSNTVIRVTLFVGCGTNLLVPDQGIAAANSLREFGCAVSIPEVFCCGLPASSYGYTKVARALARKNIDIMVAENSGYVVSDCASCSGSVREYPKLFDKRDPYYVKAIELADKVIDYSQLVLKLLAGRALQGERRVVTYHQPCHQSRCLEVKEEPKRLLADIEGISFIELPEADTCCGAAGSYMATHPEMSEKILERKMENVRRTGAAILVTSCPACLLQLQRGAKKFNVPVKVMHLAQIINNAKP